MGGNFLKWEFLGKKKTELVHLGEEYRDFVRRKNNTRSFFLHLNKGKDKGGKVGGIEVGRKTEREPDGSIPFSTSFVREE